MSRIPTFLLLLIDRRNRLAGELEQVTALNRKAAALCRDVKMHLAAVDDALAKYPIKLDADILEPHKNYVCNRGRHGSITRSIIQALKSGNNTPLTATEIRVWIETNQPLTRLKTESPADFTRALSRHLRRMRSNGVVASPEVGDGARSRTTWIISPDQFWDVALDNKSTLEDDERLDGSRRTMAMGRTHEPS